jgi:hypothetical protein
VCRGHCVCTATRRESIVAMLDLVFVAVSVLFFAAGAAYVAGCRWLE